MESVYVFSIFDIFPYFLVLLFLLVTYVGNLNDEIKPKYCLAAIFILAAIRYGVAYDYFSYRDIIMGNVDEAQLERFEPLSKLLAVISRYTHYHLFFVIGSFLTIIPIYIICRRYSLDPSLSLIVYYLYPSFYLEGLGIVRNAIAFSLVFYAFITLLNEEKTKSIILLLCAALFHKSAIIAFMVFPILYYFHSKRGYLIAYISSFLISALIATLIGAYADQIMLLANAQRYIEGGADRSGGGMMTFIVNGICILNFVFWGRLQETHIWLKAFLCSYTIGCCLWNVFLPLDVVLAGRFCTFFTLPLLLIVPSYFSICEIGIRAFYKRVIFLFFLLLFISHFYINVKSYLESPDKMSTIPYQTIFWYTDYANLM